MELDTHMDQMLGMEVLMELDTLMDQMLGMEVLRSAGVVIDLYRDWICLVY